MNGYEEALSAILTAWAKAQPTLKRLWLYGSRAGGSPRPNSDLDIAFEIDPLTYEESKAHFLNHVLPIWRAQLQEKSPYKVHLEPWVTVKDYVNKNGKRIYERA